MSQKDSYWSAPARNFRTSTRLHLQHFLGQNSLGHVLDPTVEIYARRSQRVKIADLACGNGSWLTSLHSELSKKGIPAELHGFDINPVYFPHEAYLPPSMTFKQLDILAKPLPPEMVGAYDVVHLRAFVSVIVESNLTPLLYTVLALLKPGGFFQWEESRSDAYVVESPSPEINKTACEGVAGVLKAFSKSQHIYTDWVDTMDQRLKEHGFEGSRMDTVEYRREDFKAWTDNFLAWWSEVDMLFPTKAEQPNAQMTRETWLELYARAIKETEEGVVVHMGSIRSAVGRKAF